MRAYLSGCLMRGRGRLSVERMILASLLLATACTGQGGASDHAADPIADTLDEASSPDAADTDDRADPDGAVEATEPGPGDDRVATGEEPTGPDAEPPEGQDSSPQPCEPGSVICRDGVRYACSPSGTLDVAPCPPGQVCVGGDCVDNVLRLYIVVDTVSLAWAYFVDPEVMRLALDEASALGSECPPWSPPPFGVHHVLTGGYGAMRTHLLAAFFIRRLIEAFAGEPGTQIVLIHSPHRVGFQENATEEKVCWTGYHVAVDLPPYDDQHYDTCEWQAVSEQDLEKVFPFSVYGYPDVWTQDPLAVAEYVDGVETIRDTGVPCSTSEDCGTGGCHAGTCWVHENDELRLRGILDRKEVFHIPEGRGLCDRRLLYLAAEFIRRHGTAAGKPCSKDADCLPAPARCSKDHVCVDEALPCVRQHVLYVGAPCLDGEYLVNFAKWMRNNLSCGEQAACKEGECVEAPNDDPIFWCYQGLPEPAKMCVPEVPQSPACEAPCLATDVIQGSARGWGSPRLAMGPYATTDGQPLDVRTHMVFAGAGSPGDHFFVAYGLYSSLGVAVAGGGRWVVPTDGQFPLSPAKLGVFGLPWPDQLEDLIETIKQDRASFVCAP